MFLINRMKNCSHVNKNGVLYIFVIYAPKLVPVPKIIKIGNKFNI